jgi:hypothetical protein
VKDDASEDARENWNVAIASEPGEELGADPGKPNVVAAIGIIDGTVADPARLYVTFGKFAEAVSSKEVDAIAAIEIVGAKATVLVIEGLLTSIGADGRTATGVADSIKLASIVGKPSAGVEAGRSPSASRRTLNCSRIHCNSCHNSETSAIGIATVMVPALLVSICLRMVLAQGGHTYVLNRSNPATFIAPPVAARLFSRPYCRAGVLSANVKGITSMREEITMEEYKKWRK